MLVCSITPNAIAFNAATGDWGLITHFALFDAATAGNMLAHGTLTHREDHRQR